MKTIKTLLYLVIISGVISCAIERNVDFKKYSILTTPKEINQFYKINLDSSGNSESASVKKMEDGAYDLSYAYESPDSD